jgi:hypothetical protein
MICFRAILYILWNLLRIIAVRKSDVIRFAHNDVAPDGRNDVMLARYGVRRNIIYAVYIIAEGNITCP